MDPNATLALMRPLSATLMRESIETEEGLHLAELFHALDEWLCAGGAPPTAWQFALGPSARNKLEALVWTRKQPAFRGVLEDGTRCILHYTAHRGTESCPLRTFTAAQLISMLPKADRAAKAWLKP